MITDLNKIFELWKDKVGSKRTPNPTNAEHQYQLREILKEFNWDNEVINELLYNLSDEEKEEKPNIWQTKQGNWRGERPDGTRRSYQDKNKTVIPRITIPNTTNHSALYSGSGFLAHIIPFFFTLLCGLSAFC